MIPLAPIALALAAVAVWIFRSRPKPTPTPTALAAGGTMPQSFDAKKWDELAAHRKPVALALEFWSFTVKNEPELFLPTWIELTNEEQKIVVKAMEKFGESGELEPAGQLKRVVDLAYSRAEPKAEDAEPHKTPSETIADYRRSKGR